MPGPTKIQDNGTTVPARPALNIVGGAFTDDAAGTTTVTVASVADLASTSSAKGASLVGVEDSGAILTATTVEAALAEIVKKANAALGVPVCIPVWLSAVTASDLVVARYTPGVAGKISKTDMQAVNPPTTTGKLTTFSAFISLVAVGGGAIAATTTALNSIGAVVAGATVTSANSFTATQEITVKSSAVTAFTEGEALLRIWHASA